MTDQPATEAGGRPLTASVPAARVLDLAITETKDEAIVYDTRVHHIHHLNASTMQVWRLCDGRRTLAELQTALGGSWDASMVRLALTKLADADLLDRPLPDALRVATRNRRTFVRQAAAGSALALPMIASMTAPTAAQAMSQPDPVCKQEMERCFSDADCCIAGSVCTNTPSSTYLTEPVCHLFVEEKPCKQQLDACVTADDCCTPGSECTDTPRGEPQQDKVCYYTAPCKADGEICYGSCCNPASRCDNVYNGTWNSNAICVPQSG